MSRVGKQPIVVPKNVKAEISGKKIKLEGPKGKLTREIHSQVSVVLEDGNLVLSRQDDSKKSRELHGLERALINNMVLGVTEGFEKELQLIGVGYRADMKGASTINLGLGYSHPIDFKLPEGVKGNVVKEGRDLFIKLESTNKQLVGQVAAELRSLRAPEPYKGKGVRYKNEVIKIKAGKTGKK